MKLGLTQTCTILAILIGAISTTLAQTTTTQGRTITGFSPSPVSGFNPNPVSGFNPAPARSLGGNQIVQPPLPVVTNFTTGQVRFTSGSTPFSTPAIVAPATPTVVNSQIVTTTVTANGMTNVTITPLF